MHIDNQPALSSWDEAEDEWQSTPNDDGIMLPQPLSNFEKLVGTCGRAFACTCGTGGGFLAAHAGCVASPIIAFTTAAGGPMLPFLSIAASMTITAIGTGAWALLRWKHAGRLEKGLTFGGAFAGVAMGITMNLTDTDHQQKMQYALDWAQSQTGEERQDFWASAQAQGISILDYIMQICGSPVTSIYPQENKPAQTPPALTPEP